MITIFDNQYIALSFTSFWHLFFYACLFIATLPLIAMVIKFLWNQLPSDEAPTFPLHDDYTNRISKREIERDFELLRDRIWRERIETERKHFEAPRPVKQKADRIKCEYCGQMNKPKNLKCQGCGAGLAPTDDAKITLDFT